jgi:hypothetical protein
MGLVIINIIIFLYIAVIIRPDIEDGQEGRGNEGKREEE